MDAVLAAAAAAALHHRRNDDLGVPGRHVVAQRLRACSVAYMALGASMLIAGDRDRDRVLVGFLLWMAGTVLLLLSFVATRFPASATVAAGVARSALEELAMATILALAHKLRRHAL